MQLIYRSDEYTYRTAQPQSAIPVRAINWRYDLPKKVLAERSPVHPSSSSPAQPAAINWRYQLPVEV
jgi:hypothetical protein